MCCVCVHIYVMYMDMDIHSDWAIVCSVGWVIFWICPLSLAFMVNCIQVLPLNKSLKRYHLPGNTWLVFEKPSKCFLKHLRYRANGSIRSQVQLRFIYLGWRCAHLSRTAGVPSSWTSSSSPDYWNPPLNGHPFLVSHDACSVSQNVLLSVRTGTGPTPPYPTKPGSSLVTPKLLGGWFGSEEQRGKKKTLGGNICLGYLFSEL